MNTDIRTVLIVGGGQAGAAAAFSLRARGFDGRLVLLGTESHLPYERPQLSKQVLQPADNEVKLIRSEEDYILAGIELRLGTTLLDVDAERQSALLDDGSTLDYDRLLVATGVRPRMLQGISGPRVTCLRTIEDAISLRTGLYEGAVIAIIGGGVIGLEVASAVAARGGKPIVIEAGDRLMGRSINKRVASFLDEVHRRQGAEIIYGVTATSLTAEGSLHLSDGSTMTVDRVLVCVGVQPNNEPFVNCGITDTMGVRVDSLGRTCVPTIYATGDIASQPVRGQYSRVETWANAQHHAELVAGNIIGGEEPFNQPMWFWSDQGDLNLQVLGDVTTGVEVLRAGSSDDAFSIFYLSDEGRLLGCVSINSPKDMAMARRWIRDGALLDQTRLAESSVNLRGCVL